MTKAEKGPVTYDIVEVQGTQCIKILSPVSSAELELVRQLPEVAQVRDDIFIELVSPPPTKKRRLGRKPNPYAYANQVARQIDTIIMHSRIAAWVDKKIKELPK